MTYFHVLLLWPVADPGGGLSGLEHILPPFILTNLFIIRKIMPEKILNTFPLFVRP